MLCAEHGTNLAGASPATGIYRHVALLAVTQSAKWSQKSFNAVVQEVVAQQGGEKAEIMKNCPKDVL